jgi:phosphopantetheine--protein transferase-like protein
MRDKAAEIVSLFIKKPADQIGDDTLVDRSAVKNSIVLHRMYAKLAEEGIVVQNYMEVKKFGQIVSANTSNVSLPSDVVSQPSSTDEIVSVHSQGIGIDIEKKSQLPLTNDFRVHEFYKMNFTDMEISYCVLKQDPYASFAGLFAAKEALVKAGPEFKGIEFNRLEIRHSQDGKPIFPEFNLSISHTEEPAVALAIRAVDTKLQSPSLTAPAADRGYSGLSLVISIVALAISLYVLFSKE